MIEQTEIVKTAEKFGVGSDQIVHDHFLSSIIAIFPLVMIEPYVFVGGTALSRSFLDGARVSEDLDLSVPDPLSQLERFRNKLPALLEREWGEITFGIVIEKRDHVTVFVNGSSSRVKCEFVNWGANRDCWPIVKTDVSLRYSDLPSSIALPLPTVEAFAAMKNAAFLDRHQPRDLFDLAGLARLGAVNARAESILHCTNGHGFVIGEFRHLLTITRNSWQTELGYQTANPSTPQACAQDMVDALIKLHPE